MIGSNFDKLVKFNSFSTKFLRNSRKKGFGRSCRARRNFLVIYSAARWKTLERVRSQSFHRVGTTSQDVSKVAFTLSKLLVGQLNLSFSSCSCKHNVNQTEVIFELNVQLLLFNVTVAHCLIKLLYKLLVVQMQYVLQDHTMRTDRKIFFKYYECSGKRNNKYLRKYFWTHVFDQKLPLSLKLFD